MRGLPELREKRVCFQWCGGSRSVCDDERLLVARASGECSAIRKQYPGTRYTLCIAERSAIDGERREPGPSSSVLKYL